ncbi:MAG: glycosyltransferase, partial [Desulfovibrionaceae bacterium]|nr:glycosyltransferase [Desulfovibrionaceae bacterium]
MKILFLIRSLDPGGAERQLVNLANGLAARGHEVGLAVFYAGGVLEDQLRGVRLLDLGKRGRWDVVGFLARVFGLLRAQRPDVVHGYLGTANVLCGLVKPFFPGLRAVFGLRASNMDLSRYDRLVRLSFALERRLSRLADRIVVNSASGLEHAAGLGFPRARMAVVKNGIDSALFRPDPEGRARVRREWGVGEAELLIGSAARLDPMKDHPTFLKAAARVRASGLAARFVCIGSGPPDAAQGLRALADSLGLGRGLIWAGLRRDMPAALSALDLACS